MAYGTRTPLLHQVEAWLAEGGPHGRLSDHTVKQYRADVTRFAAWCGKQGVASVEDVIRKLVGRYVTETLVSTGVHWATANRTISAPASCWKWLIKRGHSEGVSPWTGASLSKGRNEKRRRSMTDSELGTLIAAAEDQDMHDLIVFAALTGARLSEITGLRAQDCADGWLTIRTGKTEAATRRIPVHPTLAPIVARRSEQKRPGDHLFDGKAKPASKRFGRLRQLAGVHDRPADRRQSEVTFHSARHWFTTTMRNAGNDRLIVDILTGHKPQGETDGRYFGKADDALLIKAIRSLRLPTHCTGEPARTGPG